jgi:O-acetyl-ADP-ribose deacetylase (regulator of RNase III)
MVSYIEYGNIFNLKGVSNYAHGCNCAGAMGKGIALQFKENYPKMYLEYKKLCKDNLFSLGDIFMYNHDGGVVFNLGTQKNWRAKADIYAIENSLTKMLSYASQNNILKIALPKIGAGLGGLNWNDVKSIINKISQKYPNIDLFVVENYKEV